MDAKVIQLFPLGYCEICARPVRKGQSFADLPTPDGTSRVHHACLERRAEPDPPAPVIA